MNPTTMTPSEIDTQLAELYMDRLVNERAREIAVNAIHSAVGSREYVKGGFAKKGYYRNNMTDAAAIAEQRRRLDEGEIESWNVEYAEKRLAALDACDAETTRIIVAKTPLDDEFFRRPWSRFFLVTSSDGHIHSSMSCHTCRFSTTYGWKPELSGQTEVEAVEACGPALCTVCFPSAPTDWTSAKLTKTGRLSRAR